jgi:hypothetical protein
LLGSLIAGLALVAASPAYAQPSEATRQEARAHFERGIEAAQSGQWEQARQSFQAAYDRVPLTAILVNLAGAQRQTGRLVQAVRSYERFLATASSDDAEVRPAAERALAEVRAELPHVRINVTGLEYSDRPSIDGQELPNAALAAPIPVDPGEHRVAIVRNGATVAEGSFTAQRRSTVDVSLAIQPTVATPAEAAATVAPPESVGSEGGSVLESPFFWGAVGLVVVAGVVLAIVLATSSSAPDPFVGNFGPGHIEVQ